MSKDRSGIEPASCDESLATESAYAQHAWLVSWDFNAGLFVSGCWDFLNTSKILEWQWTGHTFKILRVNRRCTQEHPVKQPHIKNKKAALAMRAWGVRTHLLQLGNSVSGLPNEALNAMVWNFDCMSIQSNCTNLVCQRTRELESTLWPGGPTFHGHL